MVRDQALAARRVWELVDAEDWRSDKRTAWSAMLHALVHAMSWETGLITGVTRAQLAERAGVGLRTATSLLAWAQDVGVLVCVETGASATFLGTAHNRAPTYVVTVPAEWTPPAPHRAVVDKSCHPPASCVEKTSPRREQGQERLDKPGGPVSWPLWDAPLTAGDRAAATATLLERIGLAGRVPRWRAHGLLSRWWSREGACVAGLLYALDHHPDRPDQARGDALRAARDPLAVLGHRLAPWCGRLGELPASLHAVDGDERRRRRTDLDDPESLRRNRAVRDTPSTRTVRAAARAFVREHLRRS